MFKFSSRLFAASLISLGLFSCTNEKSTKESITINGKVEFFDPEFKMQVIKRDGSEKIVVAEALVNEDHSYSLIVPVTEPGMLYLDCGKWQGVNFWAEDEDLEINFRGLDTAKIKIKNPPYVYIKGGRNNELMNILNFDNYRGYQGMIAYSQAIYRANLDSKTQSQMSEALYGFNSEDSKARAIFLVENYCDRPSVIEAIKRLNPEKDSVLINKALVKLEEQYPSYPLIAKYKTDTEEARIKREKMKEGNPAPHFEIALHNSEENVSPTSYQGKLLLIDFWASWCGPCRKEVPNLKKVYDKYKSKNVEFLSISIDKSDSDWKKALEEEAMPWPQALAPSSGKEVMKDYQFSGIPFIILLDENGKILAKNLRGESIEEAIEKALKNEKIQKAENKAIGAAMMGM